MCVNVPAHTRNSQAHASRSPAWYAGSLTYPQKLPHSSCYMRTPHAHLLNRGVRAHRSNCTTTKKLAGYQFLNQNCVMVHVHILTRCWVVPPSRHRCSWTCIDVCVYRTADASSAQPGMCLSVMHRGCLWRTQRGRACGSRQACPDHGTQVHARITGINVMAGYSTT